MPSPFATPPHPVPADALTPFQIAIPDTALQTLQTLLTLSPIAPPNWENAATHAGRFGAPRDWLVAAAHHWQTWDWRAKERELNSVPHFKLAVSDDGGVGTTTVHFAALFSPRRDAVPLLLLHGWPGSFVEFLPILTKVRAQYADAPGDLPFHVVVPSLTGYGFSDPPPRDRDFSHVDQARVMARAMAALGFERYVVQGGDVGSAVATAMAARYAEAAALHLNMAMLGAPPKGLDPAKVEYSERELESMERAKKFWASESDYAKLHGHKPSTVGLAVGSSPIALLAWIGEKMLAWSDPASQPSLDQIVTNISIYWFTGCYPTSIWFYRNIVDRSRASGTIEEVKGKPVGFSMFPKEISTPPKAWRDAVGNFTWTRQHEKGGHFAALEQPDVLWKDIVDFVNESWKN